MKPSIYYTVLPPGHQRRVVRGTSGGPGFTLPLLVLGVVVVAVGAVPASVLTNAKEANGKYPCYPGVNRFSPGAGADIWQSMNHSQRMTHRERNFSINLLIRVCLLAEKKGNQTQKTRGS